MYLNNIGILDLVFFITKLMIAGGMILLMTMLLAYIIGFVIALWGY